jgi:predicted ATP-grasp superfamily ATP-dependent carboligase
MANSGPERRPPVIILGGNENALALARSLSRYGSTVSVFTDESALVRFSKHCAEFDAPRAEESQTDHWHRMLRRPELDGSIVFRCSDAAIVFVAEHKDEYSDRLVFEQGEPHLQLQLLDKQKTISLAQQCGVGAPQLFVGHEEIEKGDLASLRFPLLVKPITSHEYVAVFNAKLKLVHTEEQLLQHLEETRSRNIEVMLCEFIPGPDTLLCSYYSYFDEQGEPLFEFTKKVIRRQPENFGGGCYHITDHIPDVVVEGRKFFQGIGFRGLANVEFKRDPRDGGLKIIEANARFTAAHQLLVRCGMDTARIVYDLLASNPVKVPGNFRDGVRLWYPREDFRAFRQLRKEGRMSFFQWVRSVSHPQVFPSFELTDPKPGLAQAGRIAGDWLRKLV